MTVLVLTGVREQIMRAIPLELKKAIAIGIGLFIAFIGLYNSGIVVQGQGTPVTLGQLHDLAGLRDRSSGSSSRSRCARGGFRGDLLVGILAHDRDRDDHQRARRIDSGFARRRRRGRAGATSRLRPNWSLLGELRLPRVLEARRRVGARLGVRHSSCRTSSTRWARSSASASPPVT